MGWAWARARTGKRRSLGGKLPGMTHSPEADAHSGITPLEFRQTLGRFASGVTIITAQDGEQRRGMTASAFVSVSLTPPLVLVSIDNGAHMHGLLGEPEVTHFGVNVLGAGQRWLSDHFAGRPGPEDSVPWFMHERVPLLGGRISLEAVNAGLARVLGGGPSEPPVPEAPAERAPRAPLGIG